MKVCIKTISCDHQQIWERHFGCGDENIYICLSLNMQHYEENKQGTYFHYLGIINVVNGRANHCFIITKQ